MSSCCLNLREPATDLFTAPGIHKLIDRLRLVDVLHSSLSENNRQRMGFNSNDVGEMDWQEDQALDLAAKMYHNEVSHLLQILL